MENLKIGLAIIMILALIGSFYFDKNLMDE